jgi:hypothetical protein
MTRIVVAIKIRLGQLSKRIAVYSFGYLDQVYADHYALSQECLWECECINSNLGLPIVNGLDSKAATRRGIIE